MIYAIFWYLAKTLDLLSTQVSFKHGFIELNPLASSLFNKFGFFGFFVFNFISTYLVYFVYIKAKIPVAEMIGWSNDLRSATEGRGISSLMDQEFQKLPNELQIDVIRKIRQRKGLAENQ